MDSFLGGMPAIFVFVKGKSKSAEKPEPEKPRIQIRKTKEIQTLKNTNAESSARQ
jgi:hypothetical protein